jgi:hypothetical protein
MCCLKNGCWVLISAAKSRDFNALLEQGHEMQGEERS